MFYLIHTSEVNLESYVLHVAFGSGEDIRLSLDLTTLAAVTLGN